MENISKMSKIYELVKVLNVASDSYYNTDKQIMTDGEYDKLYDELVRLENETGYILASSPTEKVGYEVKSKLAKVKHSIPLLSLSKIQNDVSKVEKFIGSQETVFMLKGDGLTVELIYDNSELIQASTRGNGEIGEEITANTKTFKNIPLKIPFSGYLKVVGEAVIFDEDFDKINSKLADENKYSNSRNLVAGSVRQLDSEICSQRNVNFLNFNLLEGKNLDGKEINFETVTDQFEFLGNLGFYIIPHTFVKANSDNAEEVIDALKTYAEDNGIPIDGVVIRYNNVKYGDSLGTTAHHPLHSVAFKFRNEEYETKYIKTEWQVSRTGLINPVGIFEPVDIDGAEINRATLHNVDYFNSLKLGKDDLVSVIRSNEVIPKVISNSTMSGTETIPDVCPICGAKTEIRLMKTANVLYCTNEDCAARPVRGIVYFASKGAMDIEGFGPSSVEALINAGYIKNIADIYYLEKYKEELIEKGIIGKKKSVENLLKAIEKSKTNDIDKLITGFGIRNVGKQSARVLASNFKNMDEIIHSNYEQLIQLPDFGETVSQDIISFFNQEKIHIILDKLKEIGVNMESKVSESNKDDRFEGKTFVLTGTLSTLTRDQALQIIQSYGGKVSGSVSKKTSYVLSGEESGSKLTKAQTLGVAIIDEQKFREMIK